MGCKFMIQFLAHLLFGREKTDVETERNWVLSVLLSTQLIILNYPIDSIDCEVWTAITYFWILSINLRFPTVNYTRY